jgi:hypothetical protein
MGSLSLVMTSSKILLPCFLLLTLERRNGGEISPKFVVVRPAPGYKRYLRIAGLDGRRGTMVGDFEKTAHKWPKVSLELGEELGVVLRFTPRLAAASATYNRMRWYDRMWEALWCQSETRSRTMPV